MCCNSWASELGLAWTSEVLVEGRVEGAAEGAAVFLIEGRVEGAAQGAAQGAARYIFCLCLVIMTSATEGKTKTCSMGMMLIKLITVTSKLTRMDIRAREWEGLFLGLRVIYFGWGRFRLDASPRQRCNFSSASHR